jgi:hypothetical protein
MKHQESKTFKNLSKIRFCSRVFFLNAVPNSKEIITSASARKPSTDILLHGVLEREGQQKVAGMESLSICHIDRAD